MDKKKKSIKSLEKNKIKKAKLASISGGTSTTRMVECSLTEVEYFDSNNNGQKDPGEITFEVEM